MESIKSFNEYCDLVEDVQKSSHQSITNSILMPDSIRDLIVQNKLFYEHLPNGIAFYVEEKDYYLFYFTLSSLDDIKMIRKGKPILFELIFRKLVYKEALLIMEKYWLAQGFERHNDCRRMTLVLRPSDRKQPINLSERYSFVYGENKNKDEINNLWYSALDIFGAPLPTDEDFSDLAAGQQIFCVLDRETKKICAAVICSSLEKNVYLIRSLAVLEDYRGQGLASALMNYCLDLNVKRVAQPIKFFIWVDEENDISSAIVTKLGFTDDGVVAKRFILRNDY